jgi:hypothetical protein
MSASAAEAGGSVSSSLKPAKEDRLKMLRGAARRAATAGDLRRRVSDLQSTNEMLLAFLGTLPSAQLEAAPRELRAILPSRPHTVLPTMDRKRVEYGASPPADASPDAPPSLSSGVLPSLMQPHPLRSNDLTPQPAANKQHAAEVRRAIANAEADVAPSVNADDAARRDARDGRDTPSTRCTAAAHSATPSSEVKLLSSQKVPQLNMHSLDELRKDLFSPATAAAQGLSGVEPPRDAKGVELDHAGHLLSSTILSPVVESRAKQTSATPERNLRVIIPKPEGTIDGEELLTPLKQARLRAREAETEAGASLAALATPLKNLGRRTPVSANRKGNTRLLSSPGSATTGGSLAPTPTRQRAPGAGRQTPDNRTRMTPKGGRLTPTPGGLITPVRDGTSPGGKCLPKDPEELQQDVSDRFQKSKKGSKSAKSRKGPTRDCFMSRNGNFKTRPGTLVDSGEEAASLRKVADERIKKADERHKQILKERQEKAARNAARIKKAEKRKAELMKKESEAATNPSNGLGAMRPVADAPKGRVRNNDEIPVTENHRGQTRQMTDDEHQWRQQQLDGGSMAEEISAEELERRRWEAEEMARVASVRERNAGLRPELAPAGGPRRGVPGGGSLGLLSPEPQPANDENDRPAVPDEYLVPSAYERRSIDDSFDPGDDEKIAAALTGYEDDEHEVSEEIDTATAGAVFPADSSSRSVAAMQRLHSKWNELEFLLRGNIDPHPEPYARALQHVEDGRAALLEIGRLGRKLDVRAGALLQWVLPFDNNTSIYAQWYDSDKCAFCSESYLNFAMCSIPGGAGTWRSSKRTVNNQRKHAGSLQRWVRLSAVDYEAKLPSCGTFVAQHSHTQRALCETVSCRLPVSGSC